MGAAETSEPTLRDVLEAVHGLAARMDRLEQRVAEMDAKIDALQGLVVQGFANLGVQAVRRTGTGDD